MVLLSVAVGLVAYLVIRRRETQGNAIPTAYLAAMRALARKGLVRGPSQAARDFAAEVSRALEPAGATAFDALTEGYLAERFGRTGAQRGGVAGKDPWESELATLRKVLRETPRRRNEPEGT